MLDAEYARRRESSTALLLSPVQVWPGGAAVRRQACASKVLSRAGLRQGGRQAARSTPARLFAVRLRRVAGRLQDGAVAQREAQIASVECAQCKGMGCAAPHDAGHAAGDRVMTL